MDRTARANSTGRDEVQRASRPGRTIIAGYSDLNSRLFLEAGAAACGGKPRLVCGVLGKRSLLISRLNGDGTLTSLANNGLIAGFTQTKARGYSCAFRMENEPILQAPAEWCGRAWQVGSLSILRLLEELAGRRLTLEFVRPEYMFPAPGGRLTYGRPGAIINADDASITRALHQFADFFLLPLYLFCFGRSTALRALIARGDLLAPGLAYPELAIAAHDAIERTGEAWASAFRRLAGHVASLTIPVPETRWTGYYRQPPDISRRSEAWPYKNYAVERMLATMAPASVLDLASNAGWYARLAASKGARVIAVDNDETCIMRLFDVAAADGLCVYPVIGDIFQPIEMSSPHRSQGLGAQERFASELVMALAITHHMVLSPPFLNFADMARILRGFTSRYLLTEFVSFDAESQNPYRPADRSGCARWYKLGAFLESLRRQFTEVVLVPGPPGRRLVLAER